MTYEEAKAQYFKQFYAGRKKGREDLKRVFPYGSIYKTEMFVIVDFPVAVVDVRLRQEDLVPKYAADKAYNKQPVWMRIGRTMKNGEVILNYNRKPQVLDGFHRTAAAKLNNEKFVKAIIPESHYELLKTLEVRDNELHSKN